MSELTEIKEKLEVIDTRIGKLLEWKAACEVRERNIDRDIKEIRGTLFSETGLVSKVQRVWDGRLEKQCNSFWYFILKTVVAAAVLGVVIFLLKVYKWLPQ